MNASLEIFGVQIVVLGSFNPPIFSPEWLRGHGLLGETDADAAINAASYAITPDIARFETDWFSIQVVQNQFALLSKGVVTPQLKDLAMGIFTLISQTPVTSLGLNYIAQYRMLSVDSFHSIGDVLAPKNIWNEFYPNGEAQSVGLTDLTVEIDPFPRGKQLEGRYHLKKISVSPSTLVRHGVQFTFNDHHPVVLEQKSKDTTADRAVEIIGKNWDASMEESKALFEFILKRAG